jgi:hypothetical protein
VGSSTGPSADEADHKPPYLDMIFASKDSDGYGVADSIYIVSALPPLGYSRFSDLDDVAFLRNAYGSLQKQQTATT